MAEDYTETNGTNPIPAYKIRQANDHPTWIGRKVSGLSESTEYVRVIISPSMTVEKAAVTLARDVTNWNQQDFVMWAHEAIPKIRTLPLDFTGAGNEAWRVKAMQAYRDAGIDPLSLKDGLMRSPISILEQV
ncbi:hypothetical protein N6H14_16350 [Paenibacillus sp. CC-CFT747]|nr:hypothetical protein N6H14_16350 [Paenibacillus sp. CC-CFT747]